MRLPKNAASRLAVQLFAVAMQAQADREAAIETAPQPRKLDPVDALRWWIATDPDTQAAWISKAEAIGEAL